MFVAFDVQDPFALDGFSSGREFIDRLVCFLRFKRFQFVMHCNKPFVPEGGSLSFWDRVGVFGFCIRKGKDDVVLFGELGEGRRK